jgi:FtsZ-binding cell division protein ZapB
MEAMEKIASMKPYEQVDLMAGSLEKLAEKCNSLSVENTKIAAQLEMEKLCTQVLESGQTPWTSRADALAGLNKLAAEGKLDALKVGLELGPGMVAKVASGLSSETQVDGKTRTTDIAGHRANVLAALTGGVADG